MDEELIAQLRETVRYAKENGAPTLDVSVDTLDELFRRLAANPVKLRDYSDHDLLLELMNRAGRRERFPQTMRTESQATKPAARVEKSGGATSFLAPSDFSSDRAAGL